MKLRKILIIGTLIFSAAYTGCGDDGGGGGGGNSAKPGNPGNPGTPPEEPQVQRLATRSLGQISAGGNHTCALTGLGKVFCWGEGSNGQLGNGADADLNRVDSGKPVEDENGNALTGIIQISAGSAHTCALTEEGGVLCWGNGINGRLGNNCDSSCTDKNHAVAVVEEDGSTDPLAGIVQISAGDLHTCALTDGGEVLCWGEGSYGRLGNHGIASKDHPVNALNLDNSSTPVSEIVQISAGNSHTCALTVDSNVKCWGNGTDGRLGDDGTSTRQRAVVVVDGDNSSTPLSGIVQISAGNIHTCALTSGGGVKCWGAGTAGILGNDGTDQKEHPVDVVDGNGSSTPLANISQISAGDGRTCAVTSGGGVKCWGGGTNGRLGNDGTDNKAHPVDVVAESGSPFSLSSIVQIASGNAVHMCVLTSSGEIRCWGVGTNGELGNNANDIHSAPVPVVSDTNGTPFHVGLWRRQYHCYDDDTCEIDPDSLIRPVLTGGREGTSGTPEVEVLGLEEGESVTLHHDAKCLTESIGTGTVATGETSATINPATSLTARYNRIYAKVGEVCSPSGADYTLTGGLARLRWVDIDFPSTERNPVLIARFLAIGDELSIHSDPNCTSDIFTQKTATNQDNTLAFTKEIANPGSHTFYLKQNEICHPRGFDYTLAESIRTESRVSGGGEFTCALTSTGGVKCWGNNDNKELGNKASADTDAPVDVKLSDGTVLSGMVQVDAGGAHACAVTSSGGVKCWGEGDDGRLGNDGTTDKDHAVDVVAVGGGGTLSGVLQVSAGGKHACAVTGAGGVVCWGEGGSGRLGNDASTDSDHPVAVVDGDSSTTALTGIVQVSAGSEHTCAVTSSGGVKCWGNGGRGRLGNKALSNKDHPVNVKASQSSTAGNLTGIVQVSAGGEHTCALTSTGGVKCWGYRSHGQVGGTPVSGNRSAAGDVQISDIIQISAGNYHNCALASGGGVKCWGQQGTAGKLGTDCGSTCNDTGTPVAVKDTDGGSGTLASIAGLGMGNNHSCAVTTGDNIKCWGNGSDGRLGNDGTANKDAPDDVHTADGNGTALDLGASTSQLVCGDVRCAWVTE